MASREDDGRHVPGPESLPLWNESFWWSGYDPKREVGVTVRVGSHPNQGAANIYLFIACQGAVVHSLIDHGLPLAPAATSRIELANGFSVDWEPRERFNLRYKNAAHAFDLVWKGMSPTYVYPHPPDSTADQYSRHIEHAGTVTGTVTIQGTDYQIDCFGHRDHSWGGERDWAKLHRWDYLSAEFGKDLWMHAVRVKLGPDIDFLHIGCLWDGKEVQALSDIRMEGRYADGESRQLGIDVRCTDEHGRPYHFVAEDVLLNQCAPFGRTWVKDGVARYRCGDRVGYGIHEIGYVEPR
jgi:hypothetical protein